MMLVRILVALVLCVSLARANDTQPIRVACIGDSITAGRNVAEGLNYPAQLQELLGAEFEVRNFGVGGAALIRSGKPTVWSQADSILDYKPHVAVIALGTNDTVGAPRNHWSDIATFDADYQGLLMRLAHLPTKPRVFVCTPTAMVLSTPDLDPERRAELTTRKPRLQELCGRIEKLAKRNARLNVRLIDLNRRFQDRTDLIAAGDGVHPNEAGYAFLATTIAPFVRSAIKPPNIVMFFVDDLGWQDVSLPLHSETTALNKRYRTPNVERLANRGVRFTNAYASAPVCTPTRTSLMTGKSPGQTHITYWTLNKDKDTSRPHDNLEAPDWRLNGLLPDEVTLPKLLRAAGYRTIHAGKAHLAAHGSEGDDLEALGFDVNIAGHASGAPASYYGKHQFSRAERNGKPEGEPTVWDVPGLEKYHDQEIFLTEALQREATLAVRAAAKEEKPFFLHFAPYAVHTPIMANERYLENYAELDATEAAYATMIESADAALGAVLDTLEELGATENTIIVFSSDNGGLSATGRGGEKHTHNAPLRSGKGSAYEGGTRVPAVIAWPGLGNVGTKCDVPIVSHDFFATLLSAAGVELPREYAASVEGRELTHLVSSRPGFETRSLFWNQPHQWGASGPGIEPFTSIRSGDWKLIYFHAGPRFELYNLESDLGETTDLTSEEPERVVQLAIKLDQWITRFDVQLSIDKRTGKPIAMPGPAKERD